MKTDHMLHHLVGELQSSHGNDECSEASTNQDDGVIVDFIYYSKPNMQEDQSNNCNKAYSLKLIGRLTLVSGNELKRVGGLPNFSQPSDHLPVVCSFAVVNNKQDKGQLIEK